MTSTITLYGIANCDTVKKACAWLTQQGVVVDFHDFKKSGVPEQSLRAWIDAVGWQKVLNRQGTTWRRLDAPTQAGVTDAASALALLREQPSAIKRPVVEWPGAAPGITVGFDAEHWTQRLRDLGESPSN